MSTPILNDKFFSLLETLSLELKADLIGFFGGKHLVRTYAHAPQQEKSLQ